VVHTLDLTLKSAALEAEPHLTNHTKLISKVLTTNMKSELKGMKQVKAIPVNW
jgi:hypothetical protein